MSAPRIFIRVSAEYQDWEWTCTRCKPSMAGGSYGYEWELSAAADAGRAHLASHHTAQMPAGWSKDATVSAALDDFEAEHPEPAYVAPGPHTARPGHDWSWPCCNPIQRTYDESRSDA